MKLYRCNKAVLRFYPQGAGFLNGYTTNVADAPRNAFVDLQGKVVAVFDQLKLSEDEVWALVERKFADRVMKHLEKYLFLTQTKAETLGSKNVYWDLEADRPVVTDEHLTANVSEEEFTWFRLKNHRPLQGVDYDGEMILNLGEEGLVSYTKGCYLGQEIVARVHYRSHPPKKLVAKKLKDCAAQDLPRMTSKTADPRTGEAWGFLFDTCVGPTDKVP